MDSPKGTEPPDGSGPRRPRPRRRGPRASDGKPSDNKRERKPEGERSDSKRERKPDGKPSDSKRERKPDGEASDNKRERKPEGERRGGRRRGRGGRRPSNRAARVLSKPTESVDLDKNADEPLTKQEAAVLRDHFRFLRENRKDLRLKVNANEDLLLNSVREPVHRGVCRHLLGKVERSNVLAAAERLEPARSAKLLAGVIGFSSDIEYVLLFLEKVKLSSSSAEAAAALSEARSSAKPGRRGQWAASRRRGRPPVRRGRGCPHACQNAPRGGT